MTYFKFLFLFLSAFSLMKDCGNSQNNKPPEELFNHWIHSHEDDQEDYRVFKPASYDFPPSRGREGFEIKEDGKFIWHRIAPADGTEKVKGTWKWNGEENTLMVKLEENSSREELKLKILEVEEDRIEVK